MDLIIWALLFLAVLFWVLRRRHGFRTGGSSRRFKCHNCRHMRKLFDDGVMCGYDEREVFKNARHIAMCPDWTSATRSRR